MRLQMRGITKSFGATIALDNVDFDVSPGEVHALVGENGAGKTTLMKILSGVHRPDQGEIIFEGLPFKPKDPLHSRQQGIGMIYQELSLVPHLSVEENILLGIEPTHLGLLSRIEMRKRVHKIIEMYEHPEIKPWVLVRDLSLSAQQLVEIGRSLALESKVLIFDEPTSSLNQKDAQKLFEMISRMKEDNISIIYISHFIEEVNIIADRITILRDGAVVQTSPIETLTHDEIVHMMVGRKVSQLYPRTKRNPGKIVLEISDLAGIRYPEDASLVLHEGEIFGIFGLVGSGRSDLLRAIFGLDPVRRGKIKVGIYSGFANPSHRWQQGVGMVSENRKDEGLAVGMSVADNLTLSNLKDLGPYGMISINRQNRITQRWINQLDIRCREPQQKVGDLSGGNQQKAALGRLLYHDVDVLLLDEPTRGIDVAAKSNIYKVLNDLSSGESKKAILMISSYLPELLGICDRIAVMYKGKLASARPIKEVSEHQLMLAATGQENQNSVN